MKMSDSDEVSSFVTKVILKSRQGNYDFVKQYGDSLIKHVTDSELNISAYNSGDLDRRNYILLMIIIDRNSTDWFQYYKRLVRKEKLKKIENYEYDDRTTT